MAKHVQAKELNLVDLNANCFPDEPRRSGRATKGQHKNLDMVADGPAKRSKAKKDKSAKASTEPTPEEDEGEAEIIRCICGEYEEEEDVERDMICCDQCLAWQHNDCMGLSFSKGQEPDKYYCEQCSPESHKDLLEKMSRGEKPWEQVAEQRRQEAEALKASRRKKGKKGKRGRPSLPKPKVEVPGRPTSSATAASPTSRSRDASAATPVEEEKNGHADSAEPSSNQKRKFEEHESVQPETVSIHAVDLGVCPLTLALQGPKVKQQKVSSPTRSTTDKGRKGSRAKEDSHTPSSRRTSAAKAATESAETPEEIKNPGRKNAAHALVKLFVDQFPETQKHGSFKLPEGKSIEQIALPLGMSIEGALYQNACAGAGEPNEQYKAQLRSMLFNVKKNTSLRDRLLVGSLLPDTISRMSSSDMASEELQQKDAEIKREAERQHVIVEEQGRRIRRTHKGEEFVEDDQHTAASESVFSSATARRNTEGSPHHPSSPTVQQAAADRAGEPGKAQTIDTQVASEKSHSQKVEPTMQSPDGADHDAVFPEVAAHIREPLPGRKVQADAEIDHLLRDDEPDSPPYSPKDYDDEGAVWRGKVAMNPISEFSSSAKHVGGADLSARFPWGDLMPSTLLVDGRIDVQLATKYLCGLRFSSSTDVTVVAISRPQVPAGKAGFDKLFNYFQDRKRYGVIGKHPLPAVHDTYIVPVEAGAIKKPEFIELLENNSLEDSPADRLLLVVLVVKTGDSNRPSAQPPSHRPSQEPTVSGSPLTAATPQQGFMPPGPRPGPNMMLDGGPPAPGPYSQPPPQQPHLPPVTAPFQQFQQSPVHPPQVAVTGMAAAVQVLGPQANSPAIQQLLKHAPDADLAQLNVIREILQHRPEAATNYEMLMQALYQVNTNGHAQNAAP